MPQVTISEWDSFLKQCQTAHILQSSNWGKIKGSFGWQVERIITAGRTTIIGAQILFRDILPGFKFAYIPKGPIFYPAIDLDSDTWESFLNELDHLCRKHRAIFAKIEPDLWQGIQDTNFDRYSNGEYDQFSHSAGFTIPDGFVVTHHTIQPRSTIVVDLRGTEDEILGRMKQKTRYNIKLAQKKGVEVTKSNDLSLFYKLMAVTSERDQFGVHTQEYFKLVYSTFHPREEAELLVAAYNGIPLAALMIFQYKNRAWYLYGASSNDHRELMPTYLVQWEAMRWARFHNCVEYDLWGVPDASQSELEAQFENRSDGLWGVYRFKRGFGGTLRRAVGSWDRSYIPFLYKLYRWRTGNQVE